VKLWSKNNISNKNSNNILGGNCGFSYDMVSKTFEDLPEHKQIRLNAVFHLFGNWKGEKVFVKENEKTVWSRTVKSFFEQSTL
jgi:hypothetical protein